MCKDITKLSGVGEKMSTSATVTIENVKQIDTKTQYIVNGFVKRAQKLFPTNIIQYTISPLIIH